MNWLNNIFQNLIVTNNFEFSNGFLSNGDGTFTNQPGLFLYSGTPAAGNLVFNISELNGHDIFNNNFLGGGEVTYDLVNFKALVNTGALLQWYYMSGNNPGATFTAAATLFMNSGAAPNILLLADVLAIQNATAGGGEFSITATTPGNSVRMVGPPDLLNYYAFFRVVQGAALGTINTTAFTQIRDIVSLVAVGTSGPTYRLQGWLKGTTAQASSAFALKFAGGTAVLGHARGWMRWTKASGSPAPSTMTQIDGTMPNAFTGTFAATGENWIAEWDIFVTVTTAGDLQLQGAMQAAAGGFTVDATFFTVTPYAD